MANQHPDIPVLDVSGSSAELGAAHGEAQRERIHATVDRYVDWICSGSALAITEEELWSKWAPQLAFNEQVAPDIVEEMRSIARGANLPFKRIFLLNSMLDLVSFRYLPMAQNFGCTTFASVKAPGGGGTLIGQTYDMPKLLEESLLLLRLQPASGPRQLVFTFAGIVGCCGFNDAGIGLTINYLSPLDLGVGRLHSINIRQILAAENLSDALNSPAVPPRAGGTHFLVADRDGTVVSMETTGQRFETFVPDGLSIGHTNHYLSGYLKETEFVRDGSIGSSLARYAALRRFIADQPELDLESLKELTRNHTSFPRSICAHPRQDDPAGDDSGAGFVACTLAAIIHDLDAQTMHITNGCACENDYHAVKL